MSQSSFRPVLVVGKPDPNCVAPLRDAISSSGYQLDLVSTADNCAEWLASQEPSAVIVQAETADAEKCCLQVRLNQRLASVPVLILSPDVGDLTFAEAFGWGADDVVLGHCVDAVQRRLRLLRRNLPLTLPAKRGLTVVADDDNRRRMLLARVLRNAGFEVIFAVNVDELLVGCTRDGVTLVVANEHLDAAGCVEMLKTARAHGVNCPWILTCAPKRMGAVKATVAAFEPVAIHDSFAPHENILFVANEILAGPGFAENRSTPRLLYGASVAFRLAGREVDDWGFIYNVSADGLYIRTLAPLEIGDDVWIEMQPPRTDRRVRFEARSVWQRPFGPANRAIAPPGFGLRMTGGSEGDLTRYREGYHAFGVDLAMIRNSAQPPVPDSNNSRPG